MAIPYGVTALAHPASLIPASRPAGGGLLTGESVLSAWRTAARRVTLHDAIFDDLHISGAVSVVLGVAALAVVLASHRRRVKAGAVAAALAVCATAFAVTRSSAPLELTSPSPSLMFATCAVLHAVTLATVGGQIAVWGVPHSAPHAAHHIRQAEHSARHMGEESVHAPHEGVHHPKRPARAARHGEEGSAGQGEEGTGAAAPAPAAAASGTQAAGETSSAGRGLTGPMAVRRAT